MKTLLFVVALLCFYVTAEAQIFDAKVYEYRLVDSVSGASKADLYVRARQWFAKTYGSSKSVIEMDDKEAGKIVGKALTNWPIRGGFGNILCQSLVHYTITIDIKDGKYRCVLSDFWHRGCTYPKGTTMDGGPLVNSKPAGSAMLGGLTKGQWGKMKEKASNDSYFLLADLQTAMRAAPEDMKTDDGF